LTNEKDIKTMVDEINRLRKLAGVCTLKYDNRLSKSAEKHVDDLINRRVQVHDGLVERIQGFAKFPAQQCNTRSGFPNFSEGVSFGPSGCTIEMMIDVLNDGGDHARDLFDPVFTLVGVAYKEQNGLIFVVVDYGCLCDGDPDEKEEKVLTEKDFAMFEPIVNDLQNWYLLKAVYGEIKHVENRQEC